ncbi:LSM12 homolog A [Drosophila innubila]|uniref:LSM12 homolog A n=1 Tax=Drosophila innubila TaxID=198719 RepID=UPI00148B67FF|nr:LSM12 homolog A [Drosophila innubila]
MSFNPFPIGTQLHVETCFGDQLTGEVVTYEHSVKMLILRCHSKDGKGNDCHNQCIVNLNYCKDLSIIQEVKTTTATTLDKVNESPARLNLSLLDQRLQHSVAQRENLLRSCNEHATPRGRQLFKLLAKHFGNSELSWQKDEIQVLQQLIIKPPYRICDITSTQNSPKLLKYVQRLLEKFNENAATGDKEDTI